MLKHDHSQGNPGGPNRELGKFAATGSHLQFARGNLVGPLPQRDLAAATIQNLRQSHCPFTASSRRLWGYAHKHPAKLIRSRAVLVGLLLAIASSGLIGHAVGGSYMACINHGASDAEGFFRNPLTYFNQRSPGPRGLGPLMQTKKKVARSGTTLKPHERVLSGMRFSSPVAAFPISDFVNDVAPLSFAPMATAPLAGVGNIIASQNHDFPVGSIFASGGGGGGTTPPSAAVPEPSTWVMLELGMFLLGLALRSAQQRLLNT